MHRLRKAQKHQKTQTARTRLSNDTIFCFDKSSLCYIASVLVRIGQYWYWSVLRQYWCAHRKATFLLIPCHRDPGSHQVSPNCKLHDTTYCTDTIALCCSAVTKIKATHVGADPRLWHKPTSLVSSFISDKACMLQC